MDKVLETHDEFMAKFIKKYERENRIAKKVFFYSFSFLVLVFTYYAFHKPENFWLFVILVAIPAALSHSSALSYCMTKATLLRWKEK